MYENCVIVLQEVDQCCICLDEARFIECTELQCCKTKIHNDCFFEVLMSKRDIKNCITEKCPLCRTDYSFHNIFTPTTILKYYENYITKSSHKQRDKKKFKLIKQKYFKQSFSEALFKRCHFLNESNAYQMTSLTIKIIILIVFIIILSVIVK